MDSVEPPIEDSQRDSFAFVMNVAEITDAETYEFVPGYVFRRATLDEIEIIRSRIQPFIGPNPLREHLWDYRRLANGTFEPLPEQAWHFFVIAFKGSNTLINRLQVTSNIAPVELEFPLTFVRHENGYGMVFPPVGHVSQILERALHTSTFFRQISTASLQAVGALESALESHDQGLLDLKRYAYELGQLKAFPDNSPLLFLGYFAILESLLTHPPQKTDPYDSITRQITRKVALLDNRWPNPIDYTPFGDADSETVWKKMYGYRSKIAHGGNPRVEGKFQLLGSHENALQLVKETVKSTIRYALDEPQLLVDLREC